MIEAGMPDILCVCGHKRSQHYFRRHYSSGHTDMSGEGICFACKTPDICLSFTWYEEGDTMSDQPDPAAKATCAMCSGEVYFDSIYCKTCWAKGGNPLPKSPVAKATCIAQVRHRSDDVYTRPCGLPAVESGPHGAWCEKHWKETLKTSVFSTDAKKKFTCIMCCWVVEIAYRDNKGVDYCLPCWWSNKHAANLSSTSTASEHVAAVTRAQKDADAALGAVAGLAKQMLTLEEGLAEAFRLIDKQQDRLDAMNGHQTLTLGEGVGRISWRNAPTLCSRPGCSSDGEYHTTYAGTLCTEHAREYGQGVWNVMAGEKPKRAWLPHWTLVAAVLGVSGATAVLVWQVAELVAVHWR